MAAAPDTLGFETDAWLACLEEAGFVIGIRERLLALSLFAKLAASGSLPPLADGRLKLIGPLVSSSPADQRKYSILLARFLEEGRATASSSQGTGGAQAPRPPPGPVRQKLRQNRWPLGVLVCVAAALVALGAAYGPRLVRHFIHQDPTPVQPGGGSSEPAPATTPSPAPIYVAPAHFTPVLDSEAGAFTPPDWLPEVSAGLTLLCAVLLVAWFWRRKQRQLYLQAATVDVRDIDKHPLADPTPVAARLPPQLIRPLSRVLRQRVAGDSQVFDLPATIAATIRNAGALAARFHPGRRTPEYVALIDRRSSGDHLASFYEGVVQILRRHDVAVHAFHYDNSPAHGLTKYSDSAWPDDLARRPRVSFLEVAGRFAGLRLLVFGECDALMNALTGEAADWARDLSPFVERAWFTPLPLPSWGADERLADRSGFLILPSHPGGFEALAGWLSSSRATFSVRPEWPQLYPAMLRGDAVQWASRQAPPSEDDTGELLSQLRVYLGPSRFQWLCACALFPALSEPLTLALGRRLMSEAVDLVFGLSILGALPWFRYGSMPEWLRFALRERLSPQNEALFRAEIQSRLGSAQTSSEGARLADVAVRRRGFRSWFRSGPAIKSDAVLVDFLQSGTLTQLAQHLPSALRKRLFPRGLAAYGVRPTLIASVAVLGIAAAGAFAWWGNRPEEDAPQLATVGVLKADTGEISDAAFSPDGLAIVTTGAGSSPRLWSRSGKQIAELKGDSGSSAPSVAFSPDGATIAVAALRRRVQLWSREGKQVGTIPVAADYVLFSPDGETLLAWSAEGRADVLTRDGKKIATLTESVRFLSAAFSPDGAIFALAADDGTVRVWTREGKLPRALTVHKGAVTHVAFSPDGQELLTTSADQSARLSSLEGKLIATLSGHTGRVNYGEFSPDGQAVVTASADKTARLWTKEGQATAILSGHAGAVFYAGFSPDGETIVTTSTPVDPLRMWDRDGKLVALYSATAGSTRLPALKALFSPDGSSLITLTGANFATLLGAPARPNLVFSVCAMNDGIVRARTLVSHLGSSDSLPAKGYGLIAIPQEVWPASEIGPRPAARTILYSGSNADRARDARQIATWLGGGGASSASLSDWTTSVANIPADVIAVGDCSGPAAPPSIPTTPAAPSLPTRVYVHYQDPRQGATATRLKQLLEAQKVTTTIVQKVTNSPAVTDVRYFHAQDLQAARNLAQFMGKNGIAVRPQPESFPETPAVPAGQAEVWLANLPDDKPPQTQTPLTYPLTCRGEVLNPIVDGASVRFQFQPGVGPYNGSLATGQCTWWDRALRPGEPTTVCDDAAKTHLAEYEKLFKDPGAYLTVQVYNDNAGCMKVTGVRPTPRPSQEPPPTQQQPQDPQQAKPKPPTLQIGAREQLPAAATAA